MSITTSYTCTRMFCEEQEFENLGEVIEHLRGTHKLEFIKRLGRLGDRDGHGHVWHCFNCDTHWNKNHRSYNSDRAMWDHLNDCHDPLLDDIKSFKYSRRIQLSTDPKHLYEFNLDD
jgi:hypothetical protein